MIKFITADLDGTLLNSKKELPSELGETIQKLQEKGIVFAPASGRQYYNLLKQFEPISREFMYIAENGAMVVKNHKTIICDSMNPVDAKRVIEAVREIPTASALVCCDDYAFAEDQTKEEFVYNAVMYYEHYQPVDNLMDYCDGRNICKVAVFDESDAEKNIYQAMKDCSNSHAILSGDKWVDVMKPGVSKGSAIRHIQQLFGWSKDECMAFGDYLNDCEMMQECTYSYAMENAHPDLKKHANFTAPSNDENGVIQIINEVFSL